MMDGKYLPEECFLKSLFAVLMGHVWNSGQIEREKNRWIERYTKIKEDIKEMKTSTRREEGVGNVSCGT